jgi:hypothetical protein
MIGPALLALAWFDRINTDRGLTRILLVFSRVRLVYYVLHLFLIHTIAVWLALAFASAGPRLLTVLVLHYPPWKQNAPSDGINFNFAFFPLYSQPACRKYRKYGPSVLSWRRPNHVKAT